VAHSVYATVIAYDSRAFPGQRPSGVADLFDLDAFPGPRALQDSPYANLEWALMSYGVPRRELYELLSTPRGLRLAFDRLDSLTGQVDWWQAGQMPVEWLESGKVVMASGFNGRFFSARLDTNSPIEILWDGQVQEHQTWVIPQGAHHTDAATDFIRFATTTRRMADIANRIAYGPTRTSAHALISRHPGADFDMRPHIPTHPYNAATAITKDVLWYARTYQRVLQHFENWQNGGLDDDS
jgi:putative spermidine/putrescine transport system substrate-binding protein